MKWFTVLLLTLGLFMRGDPFCGAPQVAVTMSMSSAECADMESGGEQPRHGDQDLARGCQACLFAGLDEPIAPRSLPWPMLLPAVPARTQMLGASIKPPTPPPRSGAKRTVSNI